MRRDESSVARWQHLILSLDCARVEGRGSNPRKGRDQILPTCNLGYKRVHVTIWCSDNPKDMHVMADMGRQLLVGDSFHNE